MGPNNPDLANSLDNLGVVLASQDKFDEAEPLYRRSLALRQTTVVASLNNLAQVFEGQGRDTLAERQYKQALALAGKLPDTKMLTFTLRNYASLLRKLKREVEAKRLEARLKSLEKD